jgi:hypothetical protein
MCKKLNYLSIYLSISGITDVFWTNFKIKIMRAKNSEKINEPKNIEEMHN